MAPAAGPRRRAVERARKSRAQTSLGKAEVMSDDSVPEEVEEQCLQCHHSLAGIDRLLKPILTSNRSQVEEKLDSLEAASLTLLLSYTMNSLFWVYLATQGVNPRTHQVKRELERIQKAMQRAQTISGQREEGEGGGSKVNPEAAKRFIRNALWEEGQDNPRKRKHQSTQEETDTPTAKKSNT